MTTSLRDVLTLHSAINERGVLVDRSLASQLLATWDRVKLAARDEIAEATGGKLTSKTCSSGPAVHKWLASLGVAVKSLRRDYLTAILSDPGSLNAGDDATAALVAHVLTLRGDVVRTGERKVSRLLDTLDADDRLRRMLVFHGAGTGRFSSRVVQVHNLPRGVDDVDVEALVASPLTPDAVTRASAESRRSVSDVLGTLVRPCFVARPGHSLVVADFASIEARVLAWMAGQTDLSDIFAAGGDVYCDMASTLYGRAITKSDKEERQVGKTIILGCIAEGTPILTSRGWKPIEDVAMDDRVWDGVEWVSHEGVVAKGEKAVINVNGVWMTPDHKVLTSKGWVEAWQVDVGGGLELSRSATSSVTGQLFVTQDGGIAATTSLSASASAGLLNCSEVTQSTGCQDARTVSNERSSLASDTSMPVVTLRLERVLLRESSRFIDAASCPPHPATPTTGDVASLFTKIGLNRLSSYATSPLSQDSTTQRSRSTGLITTGTTSRGMCDLQREINKRLTEDRVANTYDILNAGPRSRFQAGRLIVHNCGYQMGAAIFARVCSNQGIDLEAAGVTAEQCVKAYRTRYTSITGLWRWLANSVLAVIKTGQQIEGHHIKLSMRGLDMVMTMPSGREMVYRDARVVVQIPRWAVLQGRTDIPPSDCAVYQHQHGFAKELFGGILTENAVQSISRDLLVDAMLRYETERPGEIVLHVHDEIVTETPEPHQSIHALCRVMSTSPLWAGGLSVEVEAHTGPRYVKSPFRDAIKAHYRGGREV